MQNHTLENLSFNEMPIRPAANRFERIHMQILALKKYKPIIAKQNKPIISFSFDDAPKSAIEIGASILDKNNIKGTFYLSGGHAGKIFENVSQYDEEDVLKLYKNGHEIACHTYSHPRLRGRTKEQIKQDLDKNLEFFRNILGDINFELYNHAFPYGEFDETTREILAQRYITARGVLRGINHGIIDFSNLRTISIEKQKFSINDIKSVLDETKKNNGWVLFFTHDISENCTPYGSTPQMLENVVEIAIQSGIEILTVNEAAKAIMK